MPSSLFRASAACLLFVFFSAGALAQKKADPNPPLTAGSVKWRCIGPANMGGRITALAVSPKDSSTWWASTASGGLLKTSNNGVTFEHQFDGESTVSIGHVAVSASNPDIVWVGTGECNPRNSVSWGDGVYKSMDGGKTWTSMGLKDSYQIGRVVIHPTNPDVVYVAALGRLWGDNEERGLFRTNDGGKTWKCIHHVDAKTGVIELRMHPKKPKTMLMATYVRQRDGFDTNSPAIKFGEKAGLFRTTNGGNTWKRIKKGLPKSSIGRIGLDYYHADPNVVYMILECEKIGQEPEDKAYAGINGENGKDGAKLTRVVAKGPGAEAGFKRGDIVVKVGKGDVKTFKDLTSLFSKYVAGDKVKVKVMRKEKSVSLTLTFGKREKKKGARPPYAGRLGGQKENIQDQQGAKGHEYGGVYRSDNGGISWKRVNSLNPRPMYFSQIRVDPTNDQNVYVLGVSLYRSSDGGKTFKGDGGNGVHADHHALWIDPTDGRHMILGSDGGLYITWDRMDRWDHYNHVAIGQFYHVGVGPRRNYRVFGGLQDNGSWGGYVRSPSGGGPTNENWMRIGGGDGFVCRVDPEDPDQLFYESQNGSMGRRNLRTGERGSIRPARIEVKKGEKRKSYRFNWNTPFILSNHNSRIYYTAGNHVFRSLDRGKKLKVISPEITETERGSATALSESPRDADVLYVGTDDGAMWMTRNGGLNWTNMRASGQEPSTSPAAPESSEGNDDELVSFPTPQEDLITGTWEGEAFGGRNQNEARPFTLKLHRVNATEIRGHIKTTMSEGDITNVVFDEKTKRLTFTLKTERGETDGMVNVAKGRTTGSLSFGGRFTMEADIERTSTKHGLPKPSSKKVSGQEAKASDDDKGQPMVECQPTAMWVSSLTASRFETSRVYATIDGHRSDVDVPLVYVSENYGKTWEALHTGLPEGTGSARMLVEDLKNKNLLFLGTEFGAFVSINRGKTWDRLGGIPTVSVHDFAIHPTANEIVAATHGRSLWIADITALRQMTEERLKSQAYLFSPNTVVLWRSEPSRGTTIRKYTGTNPASGAEIWYSLGRAAKEVKLVVENAKGDVVGELKTSGDAGLHYVTWNLRRAGRGGPGGGGRGGRGGGGSASVGEYQVVLTVDGETKRQSLTIVGDPDSPDDRWMEFESFEDEVHEEEGAPAASTVDI